MVLSYLGRVIGAAAAITLFVSLFGRWYEVGGSPSPQGLSAWEAFSRQDVLLALLALTSLATTFARPRIVGIDVFAPALIAARVVAGVLACLLVLRRLTDLPPIGGRIEVAVWAYVALGSAAVITLTGVLDWLVRPRRSNPDPLP